MRGNFFWLFPIFVIGLFYVAIFVISPGILLTLIGVFLIIVGIYDKIQKSSNILRNYPILGHSRYLLLSIRPQIRQYFIESNQDGQPFSAELRQLVYHRATRSLEEVPFGTQRDVYAEGHRWIAHAVVPTILPHSEGRVLIGNEQCSKPYNASRLNISGMSFGALGPNAILALNLGAKLGNFAHNTGEGGVSPYHLEHGGDLIMQFGTGLFGVRTVDGEFCEKTFKEKSHLPQIKMIELKLSQGAKPTLGGVVPGVKVNTEIAAIRGVKAGVDCISPRKYDVFSTPKELLLFIKKLRDLSGGKPVGFKLCIGNPQDFMNICKAIVEMKIYPDFITIDGSEGGTGAAPVEFTNSVGMPLTEGLSFAYSCLFGLGIKNNIKLISSGKIITGFHMATKIALGADLCNSARGMLFSLGCVQSRSCHTNRCPTGITTQDPVRNMAIDVPFKSRQVANFHKATINSFLDVLEAGGVNKVDNLVADLIYERTDTVTVKNYKKLYFDGVTAGFLLDEASCGPEWMLELWRKATADKFVAL